MVGVHFKICLVIATLISAYFVIGGVAKAEQFEQKYETLWFGYNKFLSKRRPDDLFITCGFLSKDSDVKVFDAVMQSLKISKRSNTISVYKIKENEWEKINAKIGARSIIFGKKVSVINFRDIGSFDEQKKLMTQFSHLVPNGEQQIFLDFWHQGDKNVYQMMTERWEKYFSFENMHTTTDRLNLVNGSYTWLFVEGSQKVEISALALNTTIQETRGKKYTTTGTEYRIDGTTFSYDCLSLMSF